MNEIYKIIPLYNGSFTVNFGPNTSYSNDIENIPSYVFLLIGQDGEKIIVDTGFASSYIPGLNSTYTREAELAEQLLSYKIYPEDIKTVILTHLHWDHAGAISLFTKASFYLQTAELIGLLAVGPYEECSFNPKAWLPFLDQFILVDGHTNIKPGLNLLYTGKHSLGHQVVEVTSTKGTVILAGDVPFIYDSLWDSIPEQYWDKYRNIAPDFFWDDQVRPTIQAQLIKRRKINKPPIPLEVEEIKNRADIFLLTHDTRLHKISQL